MPINTDPIIKTEYVSAGIPWDGVVRPAPFVSVPQGRNPNAPIWLDIPAPPMGGKAWLLEEKGIFVLEPGPGTLRTIACTHAGAGAIEVLDGIPNENGFFPDEGMDEPSADARHWRTPDDMRMAHEAWATRRGRCLYRANPVVMGSWMLDAGFIHGLTIRAQGGNQAATAIASIVWMPFRQRVAGSSKLPPEYKPEPPKES